MRRRREVGGQSIDVYRALRELTFNNWRRRLGVEELDISEVLAPLAPDVVTLLERYLAGDIDRGHLTRLFGPPPHPDIWHDEEPFRVLDGGASALDPKVNP